MDLVSRNATCADSSVILQALVAVLHTSSACFNKHFNDLILISVVKLQPLIQISKDTEKGNFSAVGLLLSK